MSGQKWQRVQEAVFVMQAPVGSVPVKLVWQPRQGMPACGPGASWKQASCAGNRPDWNVQGLWQSRQGVGKPAATWATEIGAARRETGRGDGEQTTGGRVNLPSRLGVCHSPRG